MRRSWVRFPQAALIQIGEALTLVPGVSHAGKSTLALAAHSAGHQVWGDEYCLVNTEDKTVMGWNRPLRARLPGIGIRRVPIISLLTPGRLTHVVMVTLDPHEEKPLTLSAADPGASRERCVCTAPPRRVTSGSSSHCKLLRRIYRHPCRSQRSVGSPGE